MFKERILWMRHGLTYKVERHTLSCKCSNGKYRIELRIDVRFTSRDEQSDTLLHEDVMAKVYTPFVGRQVGFFGHEYVLLSGNANVLRISPLSSIKKTYVFAREGFNIRPRLGKKTKCIINLGKASVVGIGERNISARIRTEANWECDLSQGGLNVTT